MSSIFFLFKWLIPLTSIYSLQFQDINGNTVSMNQFQNKRILLVNIATNSGRVSQLSELQQLHQAHGDSLVIIGFPSNDFGNEPGSNEEIKTFCQATYNVSFLLASKNSVSGTGIQTIYQWLTTFSQNGMIENPVGGDFQKFLVDKEGKLIGVFAPSVQPSSTQLTDALTY